MRKARAELSETEVSASKSFRKFMMFRCKLCQQTSDNIEAKWKSSQKCSTPFMKFQLKSHHCECF